MNRLEAGGAIHTGHRRLWHKGRHAQQCYEDPHHWIPIEGPAKAPLTMRDGLSLTQWRFGRLNMREGKECMCVVWRERCVCVCVCVCRVWGGRWVGVCSPEGQEGGWVGGWVVFKAWEIGYFVTGNGSCGWL